MVFHAPMGSKHVFLELLVRHIHNASEQDPPLEQVLAHSLADVVDLVFPMQTHVRDEIMHHISSECQHHEVREYQDVRPSCESPQLFETVREKFN